MRDVLPFWYPVFYIVESIDIFRKDNKFFKMRLDTLFVDSKKEL